MAVKFTDTKYYQQIAEAIRAKTGSTLKMTPSEMATEIGNIPAGGDDNLIKYFKGEAISLDDATVTEIPRYGLASGNTFDGAKIKKLILPGLKTIKYSGMYNVQFTADAEIDLSGLETIEEYGMGCNLTWLANNPNGLNIAELNFPALKTVGSYAFYISTGSGSAGAGGVKKITAPALTNIGNYAFQFSAGATSAVPTLEEVDFPSIEYIGSNAFSGQRVLKKFVTEGPYFANNGNVFNYCSALTEFSAKNAKEGTLGEYTFLNCTSLEYVDIGKTQSLSDNVFNGCMALKYLIMRLPNRYVTASRSITVSMANCGITASTGWILVPSARLEDYRTNWSTFASRFVALQDYTVDGTVTGEIDREKLKTLA